MIISFWAARPSQTTRLPSYVEVKGRRSVIEYSVIVYSVLNLPAQLLPLSSCLGTNQSGVFFLDDLSWPYGTSCSWLEILETPLPHSHPWSPLWMWICISLCENMDNLIWQNSQGTSVFLLFSSLASSFRLVTSLNRVWISSLCSVIGERASVIFACALWASSFLDFSTILYLSKFKGQLKKLGNEEVKIVTRTKLTLCSWHMWFCSLLKEKKYRFDTRSSWSFYSSIMPKLLTVSSSNMLLPLSNLIGHAVVMCLGPAPLYGSVCHCLACQPSSSCL